MQWLYDRLNELYPQLAMSQPLPTDVESVQQRIMDLYGQIDQDIEILPVRFRRAVWDADFEEREDDEELLAADIICYLDPERLRDPCDDLAVPAAPPLDFAALAVPGDWAATLKGLFRHDRVLRARLRAAVTREMCARDFLDKLGARVQQLLGAFDRAAAPDAAPDPQLVPRTAHGLRALVAHLGAYREERPPLHAEFHASAAALLARVLREVAARDHDLPGPAAPAPAPPSLFSFLFRAAPAFALDVLAPVVADVAPADWALLRPRFDALRRALQQRGAAPDYLARLQQVLSRPGAGREKTDEAESAGEGPSRSSGSAVPARRAPSSETASEPRQRQRRRRD